MAESTRIPGVSQPDPPPPPPPLPPQRPSVLQRFIAPLAFGRPAQRAQTAQTLQSTSTSPKDASLTRPYRRPPPRTASHKTGIAIAAIDINEYRTHAVVAGKDILKTVKVEERSMHEDFNIRSAVNNYYATQPLKPEDISKRRDFLPAKDVRWSHKRYGHVVATAAHNGRVALYDVSRTSSRVELYRLFNHKGQVNKLDFDPHSGYMLLSGSQDKTCQIWDIRVPKEPQAYAEFPARAIRAPVRDVRWSPTDAMQFALCTEDGTILKWDIRNRNQPLMGVPRAHEKACYTIAWHPDGKHLASGGLDKNLKVWDLSGDHRTKKPLFLLRCPAKIMNLAWRPPSWSAEFAERGTWQSTQIATSYDEHDPRIHIWDLCRPFIPFRELAQADSRPMDFLWKDKDLLWSAGSAGVLAQNDVSYAPHPEDSLPPCVIEWGVDGSFYSVVENRTARRRASGIDPAAMFINVPQERFSSTEEGTVSRSLTDDEGADASFPEYLHAGQRKGKSVVPAPSSGRPPKSQANTPPTHDDSLKLLPLDRAVMANRDLFFVNGQVINLSKIPGIYTPPRLVETVANGLARPSTAAEREADPDSILPNLQKAFIRNEMICREAEMHWEAGSWREARIIVIPELKIWADNNRKRRLEAPDAARPPKEQQDQKPAGQGTLSPFARVSQKEKAGKPLARSEKVMSNLFRGVKDSERGGSDAGSHGGSNATTPRQHPLQSSPLVTKPNSTWYTLEDAIEPIQPLPPSLASAHSAADAASRALLDDLNDPPHSPMSSPEKTRCSPEKPNGHKRSATESTVATISTLAVQDSPKSALKPIPPESVHTPFPAQSQQERRAALRDYRVPTRQPFSLDAPLTSHRYGRQDRHDSSESFLMFSASTGSSANPRSMGQSFGITAEMPEEDEATRPYQTSEQWVQKDIFYDSFGRSEEEEEQVERGGQTAASYIPFSLDGISESHEVQPAANSPISREFRKKLAQPFQAKSERETTPSQVVHDPELNKSGTSKETPGNRAGLHTTRRERVVPPTNPMLREMGEGESLYVIAEGDVSQKSSYEVSDFRPIDIARYEPVGIWSISTYERMSYLIQRDVCSNKLSSQFAAHLLSHLQPFFWHQSLRRKPTNEDHQNAPENMIDRLQHPAFSGPFIDGVFAGYIQFLENNRLPVAESIIRKFAAEEAGFPELASRDAFSHDETQSAGDVLKLDPRKLISTCSTCKQAMLISETVCKHCKDQRDPCPICELPLTTDPDTGATANPKSGYSLATYCHACGHTAHISCMKGWLACDDAEGICPVPGCGCDCGPGKIRDERIARQIKQREEEAAVRRSVSSVSTNLRKDPVKAGPSPAVDKARHTLRKRSSAAERETQSGDDRTPSSGGGSAWSRGTSFGRRVRVVEPGETD